MIEQCVLLKKSNHKINRLFMYMCAVCVWLQFGRKFWEFLKFVMDLCVYNCGGFAKYTTCVCTVLVRIIMVHVRVFVRSHKFWYCA